MAALSQKTLNWLWDVLRREYRDPQRAYSDVVQTLALYTGFAPRTDVYTSETGAPALLLHLNGTIPANFRGTQYGFPVAIWVPHAYPYEPPMIYVTPTDGMIIRPGQHVSGSDGRVYHPYLARWREAWERSTIADFLKVLADIFAREPPVISWQQMPPQPQSSPKQAPKPPPLPPPPIEQRLPSTRPSSVVASSLTAPPHPPKGNEGAKGARPAATASPESRRPGRYDAPPPLPDQAPPSSNYSPQPQPQRQSSLRQNYPTQQPQPPPHQFQQQRHSMAGPRPQQYTQQSLPPSNHHQQPFPLQQPAPPLPPPPPPPQQQQQQRYPQRDRQSYPPAQQPQPQYHPPSQQQQPPKPKLQPNLMDESPFDVSLARTSTNLPTPAIPPNPEKQHLLDTLSSTLLQNLHQQITQSTSALPALSSQHSALLSAQQTLQSELASLQNLQSQLSSNISSLNTTLSSADRVISKAKKEGGGDGKGVPSVDECVIPPTAVARQLYDTVAEQGGYEAAIYALTEGFVRGRIGSKIWERKTRECAREEFRRRWLIKNRLAWGLGLDMSIMEQ